MRDNQTVIIVVFRDYIYTGVICIGTHYISVVSNVVLLVIVEDYEIYTLFEL